MTGYCDGCGGQMCICDEIWEPCHPIPPLSSVALECIPTERYDELLAAETRVRELEYEICWLKHQQWEPADGIWWVSRNQYGRSSTLVAPLNVDEDEAIIRAALQKHGDVAMQAIVDSYDKNRFCPTMLAHLDHEGSCGVWPSAAKIWETIRDAIAREMEGQSVSKD